MSVPLNMSPNTPLALICPAGTPAALDAALDAGADAVYCGFRDETNARNFPGLNFSRPEMKAAACRAHGARRELYVAINTFPPAGAMGPWIRALDDAMEAGADAMILADAGLLALAARRHPGRRLHLSVQAAASTPEAIRFYHESFGVRRVVLPRVLTLAEIAALNREVPVETEVFAFGGMCVMAEGRCQLSSYVTGQSPNTHGVCSPAEHVRYEQRGAALVSRVGGITVDSFAVGEPAGYPTLCKGRFRANGRLSHLFEDPVSLNVADRIPELMAAGVTALKIEGRQRGKAYVSRVVAEFRRAVDAAAAGLPSIAAGLADQTEGRRSTSGAYERRWR
ncbi:ubiquinone anaerobic biosynthesis protein UbiU [Arenibaculum pallidiluteum]|uniref:ubiquinone anaerobic biosynthesis protein UbiU n=1 Tax=Arenibaculum pallidiluteum TaxID=2812559 RepID=UPI001A979C6A|nr:peptidase U32 family protein [Arenibaculum pallidiluteum]